MKNVLVIGGLVLCLALGLVFAQQHSARADQVSVAQEAAAAAVEQAQVPFVAPGADTFKSCNFNSDCPYGKCGNHRCGSCNFNSDCKGWGKCDKHQCGGCNFDSDCKGFGKCSSHRCTRSPY